MGMYWPGGGGSQLPAGMQFWPVVIQLGPWNAPTAWTNQSQVLWVPYGTTYPNLASATICSPLIQQPAGNMWSFSVAASNIGPPSKGVITITTNSKLEVTNAAGSNVYIAAVQAAAPLVDANPVTPTIGLWDHVGTDLGLGSTNHAISSAAGGVYQAACSVFCQWN